MPTVIILLFIIKVVGIKYLCITKITYSSHVNFNCRIISFKSVSYKFFFFSQLDEIIRDATPPAFGEEHLAALTAGERKLWAEARQTYFRSGVNRYSLEAIERAAFILILDDEDFQIGTVSLII